VKAALPSVWSPEPQRAFSTNHIAPLDLWLFVTPTKNARSLRPTSIPPRGSSSYS